MTAPIPSTTNNTLSRTPMALLPYQQAWCADTSQVKLCEKSRRIGLSWGEAADTALLAASTSGMDAWYVGYNKDMAQEFIRDCANWAKFYNYAAGEIEETEEVFVEGDDSKAILAYVIRFASGWRITALSSRPSNLRGKAGRVIIDEAAFHDGLDELLKAALALLMWGGQVHIISTHNGVDNPFNELINDVLAGKYPYSLHRITFDTAVKQGLFQRICLRTKKQWSPEAEAEWVQGTRAFYGEHASEELDCIPKSSGGAWLSRALIESRMKKGVPVIRFEQDDAFNLLSDDIRAAVTRDWINEVLMPLIKAIDPKAVTYVGEDFARSGDLSVYAPLVQLQNLTRITPFVVELKNIPHVNQEQIMVALLSNLPNMRGAALDGRGNGNYIAERAVQIFGSVAECVMLSESWYRQHMPPLKMAFEDGTIDELPDDADILGDLRAVQLVKGVPQVPEHTKDSRSQDKKAKRHGDFAIALVLAYYASRELNLPPVKAKTGKRRSSYTLLQGY